MLMAPHPIVLILCAIALVWTVREMKREHDTEIRKRVAEELEKPGARQS